MECRKAWFFSLFLICLSLQAQDTTKEFETLSVVDFYIRLHESVDPVLLDVRTRREYRKNRIPGAVLAENKEMLFRVTDTLDRYQPLFIYCESDTRSQQAASLLAKKGFGRIFVLREGISGWIRQGYKTDRKKIKKKTLTR